MRLLPDHRADLCHPDFLSGHESGVAVRLTRAIADGESIALTGLILTEVLMGLKGSAADPLQQLFRVQHGFISQLGLSDSRAPWRDADIGMPGLRGTQEAVADLRLPRDHRCLRIK